MRLNVETIEKNPHRIVIIRAESGELITIVG